MPHLANIRPHLYPYPAQVYRREDILQSTTQPHANDSAYTTGLTGTNQMGNNFFANAVVAFFGVLAALCLGIRLFQLGHRHLRLLFAMRKGVNGQQYWTQNRTLWWPWTLRHILYAPISKVRHNREVQLSRAISIGTLPSRFHLLLILVYVFSNIAYCFALDFNQKKAAVLAELRGRSGALAMINLVPTFLFAMRNNPFIPLLQVSYDTFNLLHRWAARIVIVEAIIHAFAWLANKLDATGHEGWSKSMQEPFIYWGTIAVVLMSVVLVQASSPVRHAFYETFINGHRLLVLFIVVGTYLHVDMGKLPQMPYAQIVIILWVLEWCARTARILYYNVSLQHRTSVEVEWLPEEACRVTFHLAQRLRFKPGSHVHVYIPSIGYWSSHPFSIIWTEDAPAFLGTSTIEIADKLPVSISEPTARLEERHKLRTSVSCIVRARTGMTRKLYENARKTSTGRFFTKGFIEGPYGGLEDLSSYGTVILFAAGVGITHQLGYVRRLLQGYHEGTVACRKLLLVWSVPTGDCGVWIKPYMEQILGMEERSDIFRCHMFVTKPKHTDVSKPRKTDVARSEVFYGRCDAQAIVDREVMERVGAMVVTVCGPGAFADGVRRAARRRAEVGSVEFVEEAFTC